ncbi:translocation protein S66 [Tulasnella sp. UAMH 9824]|nr:translocation protein S66 [Tulasnella sp. UAMH 9824]
MAASISLVVPVTYITLLVGSLIIFSRIYRKRTAARIAQQEPWFPSHPERDTYISLLQMQPPVSDVLLKAALLRRAVTDVQRILAFREDKAALQALLQKGSIGDDLWNAFLAAEKELEAEIVEVVGEANSFREGWGQFIFQSASEVVNNMKHRDIFLAVPKMKADAEAKYGATKPKNPLKPLASQLAVPSPQSSAPASPKAKPTGAPMTPIPSNPLSSSLSATSSPSPSVNGDAATTASATSSPVSVTSSLPGTRGKKNRKRK